jgi:GAF domain-containing protein
MKLHNRLAIVFTLFALLASIVVVSGVYLVARQQQRESIRQRLLDIATLGAHEVNADQHARLVNPEQQGNADYLEIQATLQQIRDSAKDVYFVYTMRYNPQTDEIVFIVDAETDPAEASRLGDVYTEIDPELKKMLATLDAPAVDKQPITDRWGTFLSGYAPLVTSTGKVDGVLGVDISLAAVLAYEQRLLLIALGLLAITTPLMAGVGWWLGRSLAIPIERLTEGATEIAERVEDKFTARTLTAQGASLEVRQLTEAFNSMTSQLAQMVDSLEEQVKWRTAELELRTENLQATAELARKITLIHRPEELAAQAVEQICQRFKLYYVGLFLLDEQGRFAVLSAAANSPKAGDASQKLLESGNQVLVPAGMVGWCIQNRRARVAQVADRDDVRLADAELPETRSEAALPLRASDRVIGALNLQSDKMDTFDEQTVTTLAIMADILAIALENARYFERSQALLEAERRVAGEAGEQAWQRVIQQRSDWSYRWYREPIEEPSQKSISLGKGDWNAEQEQAIRQARATQTQDGRLFLPVLVREKVIGLVSVRRRTGKWQVDEISILETMLRDVGQALEGARLYEETQRRAAREQLIAEITGQMRASLDLETVLQTAVREIGEKLAPTTTTMGPDGGQAKEAEKNAWIVEVELGELND